MVNLRKILCPVDLSEFSRRALSQASALARWFEAEVIVLTVRPPLLPPALWMEYPAALPIESQEERQRLHRQVLEFAERTAGPAVPQVIVKDGSIVSEIVETARELPADLIVMGTHGLSGFDRLMLGSVTERVLRASPCPVLTVPRSLAGRESSVQFKTVLCAVDFSPGTAQTIDYAISFAREAGGRLLVLHALEWFAEHEPRLTAHYNIGEFRRLLDQDARNVLDALVPDDARTWCDAETMLTHGKAYKEILRIAADRGADLIVLGVHGRGAFDLKLFGSTTQHVLRAASCPVLTVPPAGAEPERVGSTTEAAHAR